MYIARILYPIEVLGYGKRIGIWFVGCPHGCDGCSNPELWEFDERYKVSLETILNLIRDICLVNPVDGFTITGGEPFYQYEQLIKFVQGLIKINDDILVYSGYTIEELQELDKSRDALSCIAVLIDGKYIESQNNGALLRGSNNQRLHILNEKHRSRYDNYLKNAINAIQNFKSSDGVISVGIHKPRFITELDFAISNKGLEEVK